MKLTYDVPGRHWDDPRLTWDGDVPDDNPNQRKHMPDANRISAVLADADKLSVLTKITEIEALLPFLINLSADERRKLPKLGDKTMGFEEKCASYMAARPDLMPQYVVAGEVAKDRSLRSQLIEIKQALATLFDGVNDSELLTGSEVYRANLSFYNNVQDAAKRGVSGADVIYNDLKARFPGRPPTGPTPPAP